jgi:spermidine synthase
MYPKNAIRLALFALGFLAIGTQIYLMREFMMVFNDNELILGLVLSTWMLITGIGSYLGRFSSFVQRNGRQLLFLMLLAGVLPSLMIPTLDMLKIAMVPYGSMADLWQVAVACIAVQLPFCLLNGFLFSWLSLSSTDNSPGGSYSLESLGSMASGAIINFVFLWFLGTFQGLLILAGIYLLLVVGFTCLVGKQKHAWLVLLISLAYITFLGMVDFRTMTENKLYPSQQVISNAETPFGQVVVTKSGSQLNFYENGMLLFSSGNEISNEENVHYAMVQHPNPKRILLISGGFSGTLTEILKYKPDDVDYTELNPSLIAVAERFTRQTDDPSVSVQATDARRFIRNTSNSYDVVLVNLPAPATLQLNRYYSTEFMEEVKRKMRPGAVIAFSLPAGGDYVSVKAGNLNAVLWNTLKKSFTGVLIIPGGRNYFLASDAPLSLDIADLIESKQIQTVFVNKYYLDTKQMKDRSGYITKNITLNTSMTGIINRDFSPVASWYHHSWWLSHFQTTLAFILLGFIVILVFLLTTLNPLSAGLFAGGFTLASTEIILIFGLQILCGYLFQAIGAIIMLFMLGLAAGSGTDFKIQSAKILGWYRWLQVLLGFCALFTPLFLLWMNYGEMGDWLINLVVAIIAFTLAFIVGMEYRMAALLSDKKLQQAIPGNYSAEMFGSAAGAFAVTLFLIPSLGMVNTGIFLAVMNIATAFSLFLHRIDSPKI